MLRAGAAEVAITPHVGAKLAGYFQPRKSTGILDELYAKALVLDDGANQVAFVALDLIALERPEVLAIRQLIQEETGIPGENIMVSATHTHTGPGTSHVFGEIRDRAYLEQVVKKAAGAVGMAFRNLTEAKVGSGRGEETGISFNRRFFMKDGSVRTNPGIGNPNIVRPAAPIDPDVMVLRVDKTNGEPLALVVNFACHLDVIGGTGISADYPGELSSLLKRVYGDDLVVLFMTGACGDINHIDVSGASNFREEGLYRKMGTILAGEVIKTRETIRPKDDWMLEVASKVISVGVRTPSPEELNVEMDLVDANASIVEKVYAEEAKILKEMGLTSVDVEVQVIGVGEALVVGFPGEVFVELGLAVKKGSGYGHTFFCELANGYEGYIPTERAFKEGGYEIRLARSSKVVPGAGEAMVDAALELIENLYK